MKLNDLSSLPNRTGYRFIGVRHNGTRIKCEIVYNDIAKIYKVFNRENGIYCFSELVGWLI